MKPKLTAGNTVILAAGLVMLLGSFLPFYSGFGFSATAWSRGFFGIATVIVFCGVVMAVQVALATFGTGAQLPERPFGLTWDQMHLALGFQAMVMMLAYTLQRHAPFDSGLGLWTMLGAAIALFVGALMRQRRPRPRNLRSI